MTTTLIPESLMVPALSTASHRAIQEGGGAATDNRQAILIKEAVQRIAAPSMNGRGDFQMKRPTADRGDSGKNGLSVRGMNNVVVTYNLRGKLRTKFIDSHNHLVYQIPSEMAAKTQDLMTTAPSADGLI